MQNYLLKIKNNKQLSLSVLIGIGFLFLFFNLLYPTYNLYKDNEQMRNYLGKTQLIDKEITQYKDYLDGAVEYVPKEVDLHQLWFKEVAAFTESNEITLLNFGPFFERKVGNYNIFSSKLELRGGFKELIQLVFLLEQEKKVAFITSVNFETIKEFRTKSQYLKCTIILQNIITS